MLTAVYGAADGPTFWGSERFGAGHADEGHHQTTKPRSEAVVAHDPHTPHESPLSMTIPLIVLAVLSTVGGLVGVPYAISSMIGGHPENYFEETLAPVVSHVPSAGAGENGAAEVQFLTPRPEPVDGKPALAPTSESSEAAETHDPHEITQERLLALISVMIALTGIGIGWFMFNRQPLMQMPRLLENKYYVDEIYDATIIQPINVGSREGLWKIIDAGVIDGVLVHGVGHCQKVRRNLPVYAKSVRALAMPRLFWPAL